ncbi:hypothetical protein ACF0H5_021069 [Mactra antiquata]
MELIPYLPIELREKIYRYVVWANAKHWKTELVLGWASHMSMHSLQMMDNRLEPWIEDVNEREDLTFHPKLSVLRKFNIVQQKVYQMVSRCWGFSITDANLNDIENVGYGFAESHESYVWFKYMECRTCSRKPVFKYFDVVRLRGIIIFSRPVNLEQVFLILGYRARVFKIEDSNLVATKNNLDAEEPERPSVRISSGNPSLWDYYHGR